MIGSKLEIIEAYTLLNQSTTQDILTSEENEFKDFNKLEMESVSFRYKEDEDYLIVKVPLSVRNQHLVRNFRKLLSEHEVQVRKVRRKSTARYKVVTSIPSATYHKTLKVYDYKQANKDATHVQIAEACNLNVETNYEFQNTDDVRSTASVNLLKHNYTDEKLIKRFKRVYAQRCSKQVKQLLDQANNYIASSTTNYFPQRYK